MCDPVSAAIALTVASTAVTAYGQYQQGKAQEANLKYQADLQEYNAKVAENNAILSRQAAEADADTIDRQRKVALAKQAAGFAAAGVTINEGSTLDVLGDTAAEFEMDRLNRLHQGQLGANAATIQAQQDRANAVGLLAQGKQAAAAGRTAALGTILAGGAKAARGMPSSGNANRLTTSFGREAASTGPGGTYQFDRP